MGLQGLKTLHLFAGGGGGLLADLILGHTPIGAVEIDPFCCEALRGKAREGWFPGLVVHEQDVREFDAAEYAGRVDCVHAGFPCQDVSSAGKRAGIDGARSGLYREVLRVLRDLRPRWCFLENVGAIVVRGMDRVLGDLAELGIDAEWTVLSAADVGAPHQRKRWWLLGRLADSVGLREPQSEGGVGEERRRLVDGGEVPDPQGPRPSQRLRLEAPPRTLAGPAGVSHPPPADPHGEPPQRPAKPRRQRGVGAAQPGVGRVVDGLADRLEWWSVDPAEAGGLPRTVAGFPFRPQRLKALGNGQVPLCAAAAFTLLMRRFTDHG